ncbi:MAG: permease [Hormoscilla sp. SP12CHS1]|nr:permease [Hormoscilla sp. SP12CHS1]
MNKLHSGFTVFLSLLVEAIPFLLLGVLLSGLLLFFVDQRKLAAFIPKNPLLGALAGSLIGFLFPVCECGNVPVARRLLMQGLPSSVAVGFLLAAPTINPIVIWSTWTAFRDQPEIVVLRVLFSLAIATIVAWVFSFQADLRPLLQPSMVRSMPERYSAVSAPSPLLQSGTFILDRPGKPLGVNELQMSTGVKSKPLSERLRLFLDNTIQETRELGGMLAIGSAIAACLQVAVPREVILSISNSPVTSILAMMILAALVSICSTVDAFFALSFASAFTSGSLLAFLVFGPMIDLKGIGLMLSIFKQRAIFYLFALAAQLTFVFALIYQMLY